MLDLRLKGHKLQRWRQFFVDGWPCFLVVVASGVVHIVLHFRDFSTELETIRSPAFAIGVLTSSLGVGDRGIYGFVAGGGCDLGCHWWCLITDLAGVGQGVAEDVVWDVSGGV